MTPEPMSIFTALLEDSRRGAYFALTGFRMLLFLARDLGVTFGMTPPRAHFMLHLEEYPCITAYPLTRPPFSPLRQSPR